MQRYLVIGFTIAASLCCLILFWIFGCPGVARGPWTTEALLYLKHREQLAYLLTVFLVPIAAVVLAQLSTFRSTPSPIRSSVVNETRAPVPNRWPGKLLFGLVLPIWVFLAVPSTMLNDPMDEGLRVAETAEWIRGAALYKDVFLNYGPIYEVFQTKAAFVAFGESLAGLRKMDRLVASAVALAVFLLCLAALRNHWLLLLLFVMMMGKAFFWITPRMILPVAAVLTLVLSWRHERFQPWLQVVAGILAGLAYFYSLEAGLLMSATLGTFYCVLAITTWRTAGSWPEWRNEVARVSVGALVTLGAFGLWLFIQGQLLNFFDTIGWVSRTALIIGGKPTPVLCEPLREWLLNPLSLFSSDGAVMRLWIPPLLGMASLSVLLQNIAQNTWNRRHKPLLIVTLGTLWFFFVTMGRWDLDHWLKATAFFWVLALMVVDENLTVVKMLWRQKSAWSFAPLLIIVATSSFLMLNISAATVLDSATKNPGRFWSMMTARTTADRIGFANQPAKDRSAVDAVVKRIQRYVSPEQTLFVFSNDAWCYFLSDRRNATPFSLECYITAPPLVDRAIASLERSKPSLILVRSNGKGIAHRPVQKPLLDFILVNYRRVEEWDGFVFFVPNH